MARPRSEEPAGANGGRWVALGAASRPRTLALAGAQSLTSRRAQRSLVSRSVVGRFAAHSSHSSPPPSSRQRPGDVLSLSVHTFFSTPSPAHRVFGRLGPPNRRPFASVSLLVPVLTARVVGQRRLSAVIDAAARFTGVALVHLRRFFSSPSFPLRTAAAAASFSAGRRPDQDGG